MNPANLLNTPITPGPVHRAPQVACNECLRMGLQNCNGSLTDDMGCLNCRRRDVPCIFHHQTLRDRPDGMTDPMCCDGCLPTGIKTCSWREGPATEPWYRTCRQCRAKPGQNCTIDGFPMAEGGVPRHLPALGYSHHQITQYLPPPPNRAEIHREDRANPVAGPTPHRRQIPASDPGPDPALDREWGIATRLDRCHTCHLRFHPSERPCDASVDPPQGCQQCLAWGLICVLGDSALPTGELRGRALPEDKEFSRCETCMAYNRNCDRKRPCDSCVHNGVMCRDPTRSGCFARGAPGDDLPFYYYRLGYGPAGVDDPPLNEASGLPPIVMPSNYHELYRPGGSPTV
ncbi:uncharacterized protein GGS25DRAFT_494427 [Hypoxylon fragiforme]|uniref:uncharacterized protein n=1 Tax=Hypoxylon fragiforme TaxID=63214 RepID=UPI0020C6F50E|nr:uncharacterized protein GGS25DRAFT_494427 [Hypoxylon fragiforme]KAI2607123.1 hypothetical protein GGS25DRAFT_494427 [Hypoxylon fragiforme]